MIPKKEIQEQAEAILTDQKTTESKFLGKNTKSFIKDLYDHAPNFWQNFGAYWYNFSDVLKKYSPREFIDYAKAVEIDLENVNAEVKKMFDYGSDMNNWVAGMEFLQFRIAYQELNGETQQIEIDGDLKEFSLLYGFIEIEPDYQIENDVPIKEDKPYERDIEAILNNPQGMMTFEQADEADDRARDQVANSTYLTTQTETHSQSKKGQIELDFSNKKQILKKKE